MISFPSPECNFQLQSSNMAATVYLESGEFVSLANGESLPIVNISDGQSLPSNCKVSALEVNRGDGWKPLVRTGFFLLTSNSLTTLQVCYICATKHLKESSSHHYTSSFFYAV